MVSVSGPFSGKTVEDVRAYWNARPCNIRHSDQAIGTIAYFDEVEARKYFVESHIPVFADFSRWAGKKVLEIGCGLGTDTMQNFFVSFKRANNSSTRHIRCQEAFFSFTQINIVRPGVAKW